MNDEASQNAHADEGPVERMVGRPVPEREDLDDDEPVCSHCSGDGMDPMCDYLLPCWACQREQRA